MQHFDWDPAKAKANIKKHGISFDMAMEAFKDPFAVRQLDRLIERGEIRWHTIGIAKGHVLVLVVHTAIDDNGDEYIRIISARKATRQEEKDIYLAENRERGLL